MLHESRVFSGVTDDYPLSEKQLLLLVLADCKPLAEVTSGHWEASDEGRRTVPDDPTEVAEFLDSLGLKYELSTDEYGLTAVVSKRAELIAQYISADNDMAAIGRLFGYPDSAVEAYVRGDTLDSAQQEAIEHRAGVDDASCFMFSRANWQAELDQAIAWHRVLERYGFLSRTS